MGLDMVASGPAQGRRVPGSRSPRRRSAGLAGAAVHAAVFSAASASGWRENSRNDFGWVGDLGEFRL